MVDRWRRAASLALAGLALLAATAHAEDNDAERVAQAEAAQLARWAPAATRLGPRLSLRAANGRVVHFDSRATLGTAQEAEVAEYRLVDTTPDRKFFVVHAQFYESETDYWVSRANGQTFDVHGPAAISPDGRHAVTALHWESFGPEGVFVWDIVGDQLVSRAHLTHGNYGLFTFKRWLGNDEAELELYSHSFKKFCPGAQATTATVRLKQGTRGWLVEPPATARDVRCE